MGYSILFLQPIIKTKIWAGNKLVQTIKNYGDKVGEVWLFSGLLDNSNTIINLPEQVTLRQFWELNHNLFFKDPNNSLIDFPLLIKFIDAGADLSVQVHPNYENEMNVFNKNEAWYIIDCDDNTRILYGHNAEDIVHFKGLYNARKYEQLFNYIDIEPDQTYYIPSGMLHAIMANTLVLEVQQTADITYRLYDYDRLDDNGQKRDLHVEDVYKNLSFSQGESGVVQDRGNKIINYLHVVLSTPYFIMYQLVVLNHTVIDTASDFLCCVVVSGAGDIIIWQKDESPERYSLSPGDSFILLNTVEKTEFNGNMKVMAASYPIR